MPPVFKHLHRFWLKAVIAATWVVYYPLYYFLLRSGRYYTAARLRKIQAKQVLFFGGFRLHIHNGELLNHHQKIYCANHTSFLDIFILLAVAPEPVFFIGKAELLTSPITRLFFTTIDVPVNREDKRSAIAAIINAGARLKTGLSLVIFPEGGIAGVYPPKLQPFRQGAANLARRNNLPLQCIALTNVYFYVFDNGLPAGTRPGRLEVSVCAELIPGRCAANSDSELNNLLFQTLASVL